jgi:hypothetical protein
VLELLQLYASFLKIAGADAVHSKGFDVLLWALIYRLMHSAFDDVRLASRQEPGRCCQRTLDQRRSQCDSPVQRSAFVDLIGSGVGPKQVSWGRAADDCDDRRAGVAIFFSVGA